MSLLFNSNCFTLTRVKMNTPEGEKEYMAAQDESGRLYTKAELNNILNDLKPFYDIENVDEMIERHNRFNDMRDALRSHAQKYTRRMDKDSKGLYKVPKPQHYFKEFNPEKRKWSCRCGWCDERISPDTHKGYFVMQGDPLFYGIERGCSHECADLIWKDKFKNWVLEKNYKEFFVFD